MVSLVAEIGQNHLGSEQRACRMLRRLLNTGVDAVTFQIREKSFYDQTKSWKVPLSNSFYEEVIRLVHRGGKQIGFAIADPDMIMFLDKKGTDFWKTLSKDLLNDELHSVLQRTGKKTIVSTGLSSMDDIAFMNSKLENIEFIQTQLSHELEDVNLMGIETIRQFTGREVAFGLHCLDHRVMYVALGLRPSTIFFYVKESAHEKYPDDEHAIHLDSVDEMVHDLRELTKCIGKGEKSKTVINIRHMR